MRVLRRQAVVQRQHPATHGRRQVPGQIAVRVDRTGDVAAAVQLAIGGAGAERVVLMGHSFGGAVAVRVGVGLHDMVAGVATFATQSAGCELAAGLQGLPFLLFHGERDEILPVEASEMVRAIAGHGEVVRLPGDGHLLAKSDHAIWERLESFLPPLLSTALGD